MSARVRTESETRRANGVIRRRRQLAEWQVRCWRAEVGSWQATFSAARKTSEIGADSGPALEGLSSVQVTERGSNRRRFGAGVDWKFGV